MIDSKLITLLTVYETKSFTKTAERLSLTQPAISQHIKQLEKEYDIKIFNRTENELKPTNKGEILIKYAKRILSLYQNLEQALEDETRHTASISIGITRTSESNIVAEVLAMYGSAKEGVKITMISDAINNLYTKLKNYELDLAIVEGMVSDPSINSLLLDTDSLVLVVSKDNPLAKKSMATIQDIKKEKLILRLPDSGTRNLFVAHLESHNLSLDEFNVVLEVDNIATIKDLIRRDFGVSVLARSACMDELKKGKLTALPVENLSMIREINILYHRNFEHIDILRDIIKMYNDTIKKYRI